MEQKIGSPCLDMVIRGGRFKERTVSRDLLDEEGAAGGAFQAEESHQQKPERRSLTRPEEQEPSQQGRGEGHEARGEGRKPDQGQDMGFILHHGGRQSEEFHSEEGEGNKIILRL